MKLLGVSDGDKYIVELSLAELRALSAIGLEVLHGSLNINEQDWDSAMLPISRAEAGLLFDELGRIRAEGGH